MKRSTILLLSLAMTLLLASCRKGHYLDNPGLKHGEPLPQFAVKTFDGRTMSSSAVVSKVSGGPYAILVFRTECAYCEALMTQLARVLSAGGSMSVIGLSLGDASETAALLEKTGLGGLEGVYLCDAQTVYSLAGDTLPFLFVLEDGLVRSGIHRDRLSDERLSAMLRRPDRAQQ